MNLPPLIRSLLAPTLYGPGVSQVHVVETHISWVLLAGDYAYKIKKPVKLSFLDFSTLAQRKHFCLEELRLNQRYSRDIYLDVVGIFQTPQGLQWWGHGEPVEYAVKMRRFDDDARLDRVCARGDLLPRHLSGLAKSVVAFHETAAIAAPDSGYGSEDRILEQALQNFDDLQKMLPGSEAQQRLRVMRLWTVQQHRQLAPLMHKRKLAGFVRECHGDLHLANLVLMGDVVKLFDCLEFNDDLRWIDVASDLAFTYEDLLAQGHPGLANWLVNEALACSGDYASAPLLRFYAVYRALVRGKVAMIQHLQDAAPLAAALDAITLAEQITRPADLCLVITHGVSGCGKTFVSDLLLQDDAQSTMLRLRTDIERKRLFGLKALQSSGSELNAGLYSAQSNTQTYSHVLALAEHLLAANWSVLVDGTFLHQSQRDMFRQLARRAQVRFSILAPRATEEQLRARVVQRLQRGDDASEASLAVLDQQLASVESLAQDEPMWPATESFSNTGL